MFDAQAWLAAHEPPTYVDRAGKKHVGTLWSHLEYEKRKKIFRTWRETPPPDEQYARELREMIGSMGFADAIVDEMVELPSVALEEMLKDFFVRQRAGATDAPEPDSSTPAPQPPSPPASSPPSPTTAPAPTPSAS